MPSLSEMLAKSAKDQVYREQQNIPSSLGDALWQTAKNTASYPFSHPGETSELALSLAPGSGEAMSGRDAWGASGRAAEAIQGGHYGQAAVEYGNLASALLGVIPGAGIVARGTKRGAAWMDRNLPAGVNKLLDAVTPSDPKNTTNIFAGPTAKTADHAAMRRAEEMTVAGASRDDIWNQTGWFQGNDGKWRFEINDSGAQLANVADGRFSGMDHPQFAAAYGDVPETRGRFGENVRMAGSYWDGKVTASGPTQDSAKSIALHELQHRAQQTEGFGPGTSADYLSIAAPKELVFTREAQQELDNLKKAGRETKRGTPEYEDINNKMFALRRRAAGPAYWRTSGEVEARNVQSRMDFTPEQRRDQAPWTTQDLPDDQQIVRTESGGRQDSWNPRDWFKTDASRADDYRNAPSNSAAIGNYRVEKTAGKGSAVKYQVFDGDTPVGEALVTPPSRLAPTMGDMLGGGGFGKIERNLPFVGTVSRIEVNPELRGKGIGSGLYDLIDADLKGVGAKLYPSETSISKDGINLWAKRDPELLKEALKRYGHDQYSDQQGRLGFALYERQLMKNQREGK